MGVGVEIADFDQFQALCGREVAVGEWFTVTQERIDDFAEATEDRQWIHLDPARARAESPFGGTIAHGFLTLSLVSSFLDAAVRVAIPLRMVVNYGLDRVRFISPVRAGARIRARIGLDRLDPVEGGYQAAWTITIELEDGARPAAIIEWLVRYYV